jgi:hypothetical protein
MSQNHVPSLYRLTLDEPNARGIRRRLRSLIRETLNAIQAERDRSRPNWRIKHLQLQLALLKRLREWHLVHEGSVSSKSVGAASVRAAFLALYDKCQSGRVAMTLLAAPLPA